jgi:hypothetical protein
MGVQACATVGWPHLSDLSLPNFLDGCEDSLRQLAKFSACVLEEGRGRFIECLFYSSDPLLSQEWMESARSGESRDL